MKTVEEYDFSWTKVSRDLAPGGTEASKRCVFEVDVDRLLLDGKSPDEVFTILKTKGVDAMMRCYVAASGFLAATPATRSRGFEVECKVNDKGDKECKATLKL